MGIKCPKCQFENPDDIVYCGKCATPLKSAEEINITKTLITPTERLQKGSTIAGKYQILEELGRGGMGVVYKAKDTKLKRTVALKFLSPELTRDLEAKERFIHEAQAASALDHPNICTVHEIDEDDGQMFIAMAYVDGQSLREKIKQGPLKLDEALSIAIKVAEGLYEAHEKGIVHRDIKSANIMVAAKGQAKIMDFGVAKLAGRTKFTRIGTTMGTVAYMSPEQARAEKVDYRTDIWSLGVMLYEMVTGQLPFKGDHEQAVVYSILNEEPEPMTGLRTGVPMELERIVAKMLAKDPGARYQHVDEVPVDLRTIKEMPSGISQVSAVTTMGRRAPRHVQWRQIVPWSLVGLLAIIAAIALWSPWRTEVLQQQIPSQFTINLPQGQTLDESPGTPVVLSRDGTKLVYVAQDGDTRRIYFRPIDQAEARPIAGTEGASAPFFSPDGKWIGFFADGKLKKITLLGGAPQLICEVEQPRSASWSTDGTILLGSREPGMITKEGLKQVPVTGGTAKEVSTIKSLEKIYELHRWPQILPGGKAALFTLVYGGDMRVALLSLETGEHRILIEPGAYAQYVPTGHLIYAWAGNLHAVPFDLEKLKVKGPSVLVHKGVWMTGMGSSAFFNVSENGTLVYVPIESAAYEERLVWVNKAGQIEPLPLRPGSFQSPRVSPDGRQVLVSEGSTDTVLQSRDFYVYDLERETLGRLTDGAGGEWWAIYSPDGKRVVFNSTRQGPAANLYWKSLDESGPIEQLAKSKYHQQPQSFSPDGQLLVFTEGGHPTTGFDIWKLQLDQDRTPQPLIQTRFNEFHPILSPDGRLLAYVTDESGRNEVYLRPYEGPGRTTQISTDGGKEPVWAPDGSELYYRDLSGEKMLTVSIESEPAIRVGKPRLLFKGNFDNGVYWGRNFDIAPDGQRFLMILVKGTQSAPTQFNIILNWFEELKRLVPSGK